MRVRRSTFFLGIAVLLLLVLHQDFWAWDSTALWFGFLPEGLGYHVGYSLACSLLWWAAVRWAWPDALEAWADGSPEEASDRR